MATHTTSAGCLVITFLLLLFLFMQSLQLSGATTFTVSSNTSSCFKTERNALLDLKHSLVDESNRLSSWTGDDCCKWDGIRCSRRTGHVVTLDLGNPFDSVYLESIDDFENQNRHRLRGDQLNTSLQNLKYLTYLDLSFNNFSQIQIPDFFGSLVSLRYLNLSYSFFARKNPHHLGNLSRLQYLDLSANYGQSMDSLWWVSQLYSLKHLDLSFLDLPKATDWFIALNLLPSLSVLKLAGCKLDYSNIPAHSNINFTSLSELDLSYNMHQTNVTTTVPHWLFNISGLVKLNLPGNYYHGPVPESIGTLRSLTFLDLSSNSFTSLLPNTLSKLGNLLHLDLSYNDFSGPIPAGMHQTNVTTTVPHWLFNISGIVKLNLRGNKYHGPIPESIGTLRSLTFFDLSSNSFTSLLPKTLSKLGNLLHLDLSFNDFKGPIPAEMGNLTQLRYLNLESNEFTGNLPPSFEKLSFLESLFIDYNQLSGNIPPFIGQFIKLQELGLSENGMSGIISENYFHNLTHLEYLDLSSNSGLVINFSSTWTPPFQLIHLHLHSCKVGPRFPLWLGNQTNLIYLDLTNASIADNIPNWFSSQSTNIQYLYLSDNKLTGNLLSIQPNLVYLDVSNNLLSGLLVTSNSIQNPSLYWIYAANNLWSGVFPTWLCNMKSIFIIDLSNNQLSGRLPSCLGSLENLAGLDLTNNSFLETIPSSLGSLQYLVYLHLGNNKFEGHLPSSFQNLTRLFTLDVAHNAIIGVIPPWIGQRLRDLKILHLQSNRFNGPIPQQLCQLSKLQIINLGSNSIGGSIPSCFFNLSAMIWNDDYGSGFYLDSNKYFFSYTEKIWERMVGMERMYNADYFISIDLSNNKIDGVIPDELVELVQLVKLNVSGNHIEGRIPNQIGKLTKLISLDLSRNKLSGPIPQSLSNLYSLEYLNLSFNDLSGKIPTGYQLQTLNDPANYMGNVQLCGPPLNKCGGEHDLYNQSHEKEEDDDENVEVWFYSGMGPGMLVGFLGFCSALHFNKRWRYAYFSFFENVNDALAVAIAVKTARLRQKFHRNRMDG